MSNEEFLAYVAGFFDGEGCIYVSPQHNGGYQIKIFMAQKNLEVLEFINKGIGGRLERAPKCWRITFSKTETALKFLQSIVPYLFLRKREAELAIQFLSIPIRPGNKPLADEVWLKKCGIVSEMKETSLKRRT